jgi:cytochrome c oxidase subunit 3
MWMFLATVAMLFAAFSSAYIVRRSGSDWIRIDLPDALWTNTLVLCASSVALELGSWGGTRKRWNLALCGLSAALVLGIGFLVGQVRAWQQLQLAGVYLPSSPHSSFFYLLTGAHGVHVVGALAVLGHACVVAVGSARFDARRWSNTTASARTFWHFLLGVWLAVLWLLEF